MGKHLVKFKMFILIFNNFHLGPNFTKQDDKSQKKLFQIFFPVLHANFIPLKTFK